MKQSCPRETAPAIALLTCLGCEKAKFGLPGYHQLR